MTRRSIILAALIVATACTASTGPCGPATITIDVTVRADAMEPSEIAACRDQGVTIEIASEADGEFHVHGYVDDGISLTDGETATTEFTAEVAGQFIIEFHPADGGDEIEIGVLTVHEP